MDPAGPCNVQSANAICLFVNEVYIDCKLTGLIAIRRRLTLAASIETFTDALLPYPEGSREPP